MIKLTEECERPISLLPAIWETEVRSLGWEDPLEKSIENYSIFLA